MEPQEKRWRPGDRALKFSTVAKDKFDKSPRWLWAKIKTPGVPQPFYIDSSPHFIEREVDAFLSLCAEKVAA
jgi:hypothetical protein